MGPDTPDESIEIYSICISGHPVTHHQRLTSAESTWGIGKFEKKKLIECVERDSATTKLT
jgi:hypothetical protein